MNFWKAQLTILNKLCFMMWKFAYWAKNITLLYWAAIYQMDIFYELNEEGRSSK